MGVDVTDVYRDVDGLFNRFTRRRILRVASHGVGRSGMTSAPPCEADKNVRPTIFCVRLAFCFHLPGNGNDTMDKIASTFSALRQQNQIALMPFIPAGYPDLATTAAVLPALEGAG